MMACDAHLNSVLAYAAHIGAGVCVDVDLAAPWRPCPVSADAVDGTTNPLLKALVGPQAMRRVGRSAERPPTFKPSSAPLWARVAMIDALNFWLPSALDQSLVDAERGVARGRAAKTLPVDSEVRGVILGEAVNLARRASRGVVRYLRALAAHRGVLPVGLVRVLEPLVAGYGELLADVDNAADRQLSDVRRAWEAVAALRTSSYTMTPEAPARRPRRHPTRPRRASMIDPRQVQARVLALSRNPGAAEITVADTQLGDRPALLVRVPAYRRALDQPVVQRLRVRLLDGRSDAPRGQSLLTVEAKPPRGSSTVHLESIVELPGADVAPLRVDVFDALSKAPPALADTDEELQEVRRALAFLDEWRQLMAASQVSGTSLAPRLRELAECLAPGDVLERPLFPGGPSGADLRALARTGDAALLRRTRTLDEDGGGASDLFGLTTGAAGLLAAEVATADAENTRL
ncbi:hypothetical protein [Pseudonocardia charpentierae]|uniref:Uncharacterized protein n=1 Tax=Pseudonocardia charpentierae TaxID=3075545 RepID=A0ABU2N7R2_9PSEU|nr:hypothetical protein [Pseudonocardia sp. DSM 45834]MDT0349528.1 hypothetical protein [Pseudonocardia sp. DSM 45834]